MSLTCEFCNRKMSSTSSLNLHKKTAKYCLKIQNKEVESKNFECNFCKITLSSKQNLTTHQKSCKELITILENDNKTLRKTIEDLKEENMKLKNDSKIKKENITINVNKLPELTNEKQFNIINSEDDEEKWKFMKRIIGNVNMILYTYELRNKFVDSKDTRKYNILNHIFELICGFDSYSEYKSLIRNKNKSSAFEINNLKEFVFIRDLVDSDLKRFNVSIETKNFINIILTELVKEIYNNPLWHNDNSISDLIQNPEEYANRPEKEVEDDLKKYDIPIDFRTYLKFISFEDIKRCVYSQTIQRGILYSIMKCRHELFKNLVKEYEGITFY